MADRPQGIVPTFHAGMKGKDNNVKKKKVLNVSAWTGPFY